MIADIFEAVKESEVFLNCNLLGSTISALTQSYIWIKIEPLESGGFGIYEKENSGWEIAHSGDADEIIGYINHSNDHDND